MGANSQAAVPANPPNDSNRPKPPASSQAATRRRRLGRTGPLSLTITPAGVFRTLWTLSARPGGWLVACRGGGWVPSFGPVMVRSCEAACYDVRTTLALTPQTRRLSSERSRTIK
jgi:hypothetical protein